MTSPFIQTSRRIHDELSDIEKAIARAQTAWKQYQSSRDELYLDSVALSLHGFYSGIEGVLESIATNVDKHLPGGRSWHRKLLDQMASDVPTLRPAVISSSTSILLDEYRRFRHVVRNVYSYKIDPIRLQPLAEEVDDVFSQVSDELTAFARWLVVN